MMMARKVDRAGGLLAALLVLSFAAASAHAAPLCERPAPRNESIRLVNSFADDPPLQAIAAGRGRCGWGLGLATGPSGSGTGFIVGHRREVMTDLHVVDKFCRGNRHFTFQHGYDRGHGLSTQIATVVAHGDYCAKLSRGRHDYSGDWAIAVLEEDPMELERTPPGADIAPLAPRLGGTWSKENGRYYLLGYSMSFRAGQQLYSAGPCRFGRLFSDGVVEHDCDASHRSSGAPIISEDADGGCEVAAIHVGEIADVPGRPAYRAGVNANVAVLSSRFAATVNAVARALEEGRDLDEIAADLAAHPPHR